MADGDGIKKEGRHYKWSEIILTVSFSILLWLLAPGIFQYILISEKRLPSLSHPISLYFFQQSFVNYLIFILSATNFFYPHFYSIIYSFLFLKIILFHLFVSAFLFISILHFYSVFFFFQFFILFCMYLCV